MNNIVKDTLENTIVKWFVRGLTGLFLISEIAYLIFKRWTVGEIEVPIDSWWLMGGSLTIWIAYEAAVGFLKRKAGQQ